MSAWNELTTTGRLGRAGFWLRNAFALPICLFLCISADSMIGPAAGLVAAALTTLFLVSTWGRRLHDRGRSAWWLLLTAVPVVGALALIVDCAFLGPRAGAQRFGTSPGVALDYRTV
jgi:uncharacterized membrane protein YhaH (DUF805 family)